MNAMAAGFGAAAAACNVRLCLSCFQGFGGIPGNAASDDNRHAIQVMRTRMPKPGARGQRSHTGRLQEGAALRANVSKVHSLDSQHTKESLLVVSRDATSKQPAAAAVDVVDVRRPMDSEASW